jgi:quercetin dioxygenase-like cupin family protein
MLRTRLSKLLSLSGEMMLPRIEEDISRRLVLGGLVGAATAFANRRALAETSTSDRTVVSSDGIIRTMLESYVNDAGEDFRLVLTTFPPAVGLPLHHHPSVAHNYVLEGVAESQYLGEELKRFIAGESYRDKAVTPHAIFRNGDRSAPLKYLIAYTVKKGQPFLIIP